MSVIIKMLRDLEQRQKPESEQSTPTSSQSAGEFVRPQVQYYQAEPSRFPLIAIGLGLLLLVPALWFGFSAYQQAETPYEPQLAKAELAPQSIPQAPINDVNKLSGAATDTVAAEPEADVAINETAMPSQLVNEQASSIVAQADMTQHQSTSMVDETLAKPADKLDSNAQNTVPAISTAAQASTKGAADTTTVELTAQSTPKGQAVASTKNEIEPPVEKPVLVSTPSNMTVKEVVLTKAQMAQLQYRKALEAEKAQELDDAASFYLEAIILQPNLHKARKQLVAIYYAQNNPTTAMRLLESGISMFPREWEFYVILSRIQAEEKAYDSALTTLASIPDDSSWARDKWVAQTELAQSTQHFVLAEQAYRSLLLVESTQARWWMGLGYALDSQQKYIPAAQAYRSALSYEGLSTTAMNFIETRLAQLGENR
ncbi:tetratricopeptide repeat protein [Shewanella inventionis]|uniref:MSHA biogenesis protein MshN n=1 Tax=Shewanella inventionis TaxID=1738770 RepID=A0ABQ1JC73_9GAMM|nr:tetratricopeptide repeat protein [Shewanella inventionis]MCL1157997.1 tetratricopeptide repeat protein [Shewanella inventionis]UAL44060.1 tetratricopeptide repeat protein [Shewanella inventionis]GGB62822.1 MSHA biogenesis protein MshN [Shewanella inventionis]